MYVELDDDCIYNILTYLEAFDIIKCSLINKQFNFVSKNEILWKKLYEDDFSHVKRDSDYYKNYRKQIKLDIGIIDREIENYWEQIKLYATVKKFGKYDDSYFSLFNKRITYISPQFKKLPNLRTLCFNGNNIKTIPISLCELSNLRILNLSNNELKFIPSEIEKLTQLEKLCIDYNKLKTIPAEIGNLKNLCELSINNNPLENLPIELNNLKKFKKITIDRAAEKYIPTELKNVIVLK